MNCIVPFESTVKFDGPVKEISSISLEHEVTKNEKEILGNFIISGTYKGHELSVNTLDFNFVIPFSLNLATRIDEDSFEFMIDNFTYDISGDEMNVRIDYMVNADDVIEEIEDARELTEVEIPLDDLPEPEEMIVTVEDSVDSSPEEDREYDATEAIMGVKTEEDYVKYHVHIVKDGQNIEEICKEYNVSKEMIINLNDSQEIMPMDKLLILMNNE